MERVELSLGRQTLSIETGRMAKQADGATLVRIGDTVVLVTACAAPTGAPAAPAAQPPALWGRVQAEVGDAACTSNSQCRSIAIGHKACGGPESYLAWSTSVSNEATLKDAVAAHAEARRKEDEQSGRVSNCMMLMDPGAVCEAGRCVLNRRGARPPVM